MKDWGGRERKRQNVKETETEKRGGTDIKGRERGRSGRKRERGVGEKERERVKGKETWMGERKTKG